jgi:hypothetical protein
MNAGQAQPDRVTILFNSTHHAMWAEDVARDRKIPAEVVPAPADADAKCGLALETLPAWEEALTGALEDEGIEFMLHGLVGNGSETAERQPESWPQSSSDDA